MNKLCQGCKWYYYVRGWDADDPNAACSHEKDNPEFPCAYGDICGPHSNCKDCPHDEGDK